MPHRDIVVLGASAGGVEALGTVLGGLPEDLPAAVFVVMHTSAESPGILPQILDRQAMLPLHEASDGEAN
jgi:two-component system chemotaxis response regulator CheB